MRKKKFIAWSKRLRETKIRAITEALEASDGFVPEAADLLDVAPRTLRRWLHDLGLGHLSLYRSGGEPSKRAGKP